MPGNKLRRIWICGTVVAVAGTMLAQNARTEFFHKRATVRTGLPVNVGYGRDTPRVTASVVTSQGVEEQVLLVLTKPTLVPIPAPDAFPWQNSASPSVDSVLSRPSFRLVVPGSKTATVTKSIVQTVPSDPVTGAEATIRNSTSTTDTSSESRLSIAGQVWTETPASVGQPTLVRRKSFAPSQPGIVAEDVTLDRIGLSIYETGHVAFTGLISHSGGQDGLVRGSNVTLRVRGYGQNRLTSPTVPNGPLLFEMRKSCRVLKGDSEAISLVPSDCCEIIRLRYDEITHLEVNLESCHSR